MFSDFAGNVASPEFSDYQSGFRRCVANVDQYMLMTDSMSGGDRWMLSQLSGKLWRSRSGEEAVSTTDSGPSSAPARGKERRIQPKAPEETKDPEPPTSDVNALPRLPTEDTRLQTGSRQVHTDAAAAQSPTQKKTDAGANRNESANIARMWRPW